MNGLSTLGSGLVRAGGTLLSRGGARASLLVLIYHRVLAEPDPMLPSEPDATAFAGQMDVIAQNFVVLPLREAVARLQAGTLPSRAVCITFDDGYANNFTVAMPILAARQLPATVFVAAGYLDGGCMFNDMIYEACRAAPRELDLGEFGLGTLPLSETPDRLRTAQRIVDQWKYLPRGERLDRAQRLAERAGACLDKSLMMTTNQVALMSREGIEIGAHTMTHPILARAEAGEAREEIVQSRRRLEDITGAPVLSFAYPNGRPGRDYAREHVDAVRDAGFELAVSTSWGAATAQSDPFQIPRIAPWDRQPLRYAARMVNAYRERRFACA